MGNKKSDNKGFASAYPYSGQKPSPQSVCVHLDKNLVIIRIIQPRHSSWQLYPLPQYLTL